MDSSKIVVLTIQMVQGQSRLGNHADSGGQFLETHDSVRLGITG
jgi:hypothetical protein